jgi:hypothetical protein
MAPRKDFEGLERLLRPLRRDLSFELANALVRLKADDEIQNRYDELADKNTAGTLIPAEQAELESLVRANSILSVLKIEARARLPGMPAQGPESRRNRAGRRKSRPALPSTA